MFRGKQTNAQDIMWTFLLCGLWQINWTVSILQTERQHNYNTQVSRILLRRFQNEIKHHSSYFRSTSIICNNKLYP